MKDRAELFMFIVLSFSLCVFYFILIPHWMQTKSWNKGSDEFQSAQLIKKIAAE